MRLRIGLVYITIYKAVGSNLYRGSIYGTLPFKDTDADTIEEESIIDMIITLTLNYCEGGMLPIEEQNKFSKEWSKW